MVWKPKEKELTPEEAIKMAKAELAPYWIGSPPLLAAVKNSQGKASAYPLDVTFAEQKWLLLFFNPTDLAGQNALIYFMEWQKRFAGEDLKVLAIMKPVYQFFKEPQSLEQLSRKMELPFPLISDANELLFAAFGVTELPSVLLIDRNKHIFKKSGLHWMEGLELELHRFFRSHDPGLPLLPPYKPAVKLPEDIMRIEFGHGRGARFSAPGFGNPMNGFSSGKFAASGATKRGAGEINLVGTWIQDGDRIITSDPKAELSIEIPTSRFGMIAKSLSKTVEVPRVNLEVGGIPANDAFGDEHLSFDEEGQSCVQVEEGRFYQVLFKLPTKSRLLTLKFPMAARIQVALYGFRFSE